MARTVTLLLAMVAPDAAADVKATNVDLQYLMVPGTEFKPSDSSMTYAYAGNACLYATGNVVPSFQATVGLPAGATVKLVRLIYYDASAGDSTLFLTRYKPGLTNVDLLSVSSTGTAGYGQAVGPEITEVVDPGTYAYVLTWRPTFNINAQQICAAQVVYYPPAASSALCTLDADGNGSIDALSDGILIMRAMFGLTGTTVTNNAIGSGSPTRTTWAQLRSYFNGSCGASFAQ